MITTASFYDFDGTLMNSPHPEDGVGKWEDFYGEKYPYGGWWGKPNSLDLEVFDIKPNPSIHKQFMIDNNNPDTITIILTARVEKMRPYVQKVLDYNEIRPYELNLKYNGKTKGEKVLEYIENFNELTTVNVFDDNDVQIKTYLDVRSRIPEHIQFNIYKVNGDSFSLVGDKIQNIVNEEISKFINNKYL